MNRIDTFDGEYRWLSNFWPAEVEVRVLLEGKVTPVSTRTVEHAYQALKTMNPELRLAILSCTTPGQAKRLGKSVELRDDWEFVKVEFMRRLLVQKFRNPELRQKLLATGDAELVEGNTWNDTFWGVCRGKGQNQLGKLLMQLRASLQEK